MESGGTNSALDADVALRHDASASIELAIGREQAAGQAGAMVRMQNCIISKLQSRSAVGAIRPWPADIERYRPEEELTDQGRAVEQSGMQAGQGI